MRPERGFIDATDPQGWLLGKVNRIYAAPTNPNSTVNYTGRIGFITD